MIQSPFSSVVYNSENQLRSLKRLYLETKPMDAASRVWVLMKDHINYIWICQLKTVEQVGTFEVCTNLKLTIGQIIRIAPNSD
jgi:hypothetical protein